jgi:hypothetical protein
VSTTAPIYDRALCRELTKGVLRKTFRDGRVYRLRRPARAAGPAEELDETTET